MITNDVFLCVFIFSFIKIFINHLYVFVYIPVSVYEYHMCVEGCKGQKRHRYPRIRVIGGCEPFYGSLEPQPGLL